MSETTTADAATEAEAQKHYVKFKNPHKFEGKKYEGVDLSGLDSLTVKDLINAQAKVGADAAAVNGPEATTAFACALATRASGKPVEFFDAMKYGNIVKVQAEVLAAIAPDKADEGHTLKLTAPYVYMGDENKELCGKEYTEVALDAVGEMTAKAVCAAESKAARAGVAPAQKLYSYLYAAVLASMASGLPVDFFTGLPAKDGIKLRSVVNSADFFE